jgi:signal transduction histidine kinase
MERLVMSFRVKEEERSRIATELHDEIGSTISSISILSDVIIREKNETSIRSMQQEIKSNAKLIMEKMDDIIWSLNPKNDSMEKMLLRIRQFASPLFEARNINYDYKIDNEVYTLPLPIEQRQQAYLILKEGINNLVKHAACTEANITAKKEANNMLVFSIADNGKGFKTANESTGNGLENMKNRARNMGAEIEFISLNGIGTTINLVIKLG